MSIKILQIGWIVLALLILTNCQEIPDVTIISQRVSGNEYTMTCVINESSTDSAIIWNQPLLTSDAGVINSVSVYSPTRNNNKNCDIDFNGEYCDNYWSQTDDEFGWKLQQSFDGILSPVTDSRWERFRIYYTSGENSFKSVASINNPNFSVHFSLRIKQEAHVYLCSSKYPPNGKCYWILLGGFDGASTAIRKCAKEKVPKTGYPKKDCRANRDKIDHDQSNPILNSMEWRHFTITTRGNTISLWQTGRNAPLLDYDDKDGRITTPFLSIKSRDTPGYWKFHDYAYTFTNTEEETILGEEMYIPKHDFCMTMFVAMCGQCNLILRLVESDVETFVVWEGTIKPQEAMAWQQVKFVITMPAQGMSVRLRVISLCPSGYCDSPFWAIDNFQVCTEKELRVLRIQNNINRKASCQVIKYPSWHLAQTDVQTDIVPENNCPLGRFGKNCIECRYVLGSTMASCQKSVICDLESNGQNICRCARGYEGATCEADCAEGFYGSGCIESCGSCVYAPCDRYSGYCKPSYCLFGFTDPRCKTPIFPVLLNPPTVTDFSHTYFTVQIKNETYEGLRKPVFYKIQYREEPYSESGWNESPQYFYSNTPEITINNLKILTTYTVRAILLTENNEKFDKAYYVRNSTVITTCAELKPNDIKIDVSNTSAILTFIINPESCRLIDYQVFLDQKFIERSTEPTMYFGELRPATTYNITIKNSFFKPSISKSITTTDGAPEGVEELQAINQDSTSITISWKQPSVTNGKIRYYYIQYKHINYLGCKNERTMNIVSMGTIREELTSTNINNLLPYSEYEIEVVAVTTMNGKPSIVKSTTLQTNSLDQMEIPTIKELKVFDNRTTITLEPPNCVSIKGPVVYYMNLECSNSWCSEKHKNITHIKNNYGPIILKSLQAYCNYTMKIKVGRKDGNIFNEKEIIASFNTKISVPHKINNLTAYSKNVKSISLRFLPPYPPTGVIGQYYLKYCYDDEGYFTTDNVCKQKYSEPIECKLWGNFHCVTLEDLETKKLYRIEVQSKNVGNKAYNNLPESISVTTIQEAPGHIENFTASWDDNYSLHLSWGHPDIANGPLTKFIVRTSTKSEKCYETNFPINEENYTATYNYMIALNKCYSSILTISAAAFNIKEGPSATTILPSPPKTPTFIKEPTIESVTNTTITILLPVAKDLGQNSTMYVIVTTANSGGEYQDYNEVCKNLDIPNNAMSWIAAEYDFTKIKAVEQFLTIGDENKTQSTRLNQEIHNQILHPTTNYTIYVTVSNEFMGLKRCDVSKIDASIAGVQSDMEKESSNNFGLLGLIPLFLAGIVLVIFIIHRRKQKEGVSWASMLHFNINTAPSNSNPDVIPLESAVEKKPGKIVAVRPKRVIPNNVQGNTSNPSTSIPDNKFSKPVKIIEFENYVKESIENGELERQHQLFKRGQTKPWDYGLLPQNKSKNRYNNLIAYDHTRVKLAKIKNDPCSDYINANYIEGYNSKKAYIATQGPKVSTVNDFWRMIWQENVNCIIMLANVIEGGKKKTEQYWPNINEYLEFDSVKVEYASSRVFADYEYRTFWVFCNNEERKVEHLHFTSWPDHAVPLYSQSLVPFLRKMLTIPQGSSPVVVHCSAGVGRTGTIILIDLCLRMAAREGVVDILKHQFNLREQRANLVDNIEQYKLAHLVLLECLIAPHTSITCDEEMEETVSRLLQSDRVAQQMVYLNETAWQDQAMRPPINITPIPEWSSKNRCQDIIPCGYGRVYLSRYPASDEHSDYINAVEVDGFRLPQRFIVTQQPLPHTISDFWRMIDEKEVTTVVSLNKINLGDETSCVFWPTAKVTEIQPVPFLTLHFHDKSNTDHYSVITIHLQNTKDKQNTKRSVVSLIILKGWPPNKLLLDEEEPLLHLWEETERVSRGNTPIVVTCYDGAKACGLFIALSFVVEKMKLEQECDVCLAVRTVRHNRKQFVNDIDQLLYLYRAALKYLACFDLYSNFTTTPGSKKMSQERSKFVPLKHETFSETSQRSPKSVL